MRKLITLMLSGLFLLPLLHCSSKIGTLCEQQQTCEGGNDKDVKACEEALAGERDVAAAYDCKSQFTEALACVADKGSCTNRRFSGGTACKALSDSLEACKKAASGIK
jgi:hypothetical protein